jgi:hypothetical protein
MRFARVALALAVSLMAAACSSSGPTAITSGCDRAMSAYAQIADASGDATSKAEIATLTACAPREWKVAAKTYGVAPHRRPAAALQDLCAALPVAVSLPKACGTAK